MNPRPLTHVLLSCSLLATPPLWLAAGDLARQDPKPAASAQDPKADAAAKEAKVRELLVVTGAAQMGQQMMEQMSKTLADMPGLPEGFMAKFLELAKPDDLVELIVPIYMKHIETKDLDPLLAFLRSDCGRRWIEVQPKVMAEAMAAGEAWGRDLGLKTSQALQKGK